MDLFIWLFSCILYNKLVNVSKRFPELCEPFYKLLNLRRASWDPRLTAFESEAQVTTWTCDWYGKGQPCGTESLTCGICAISRQIVLELS